MKIKKNMQSHIDTLNRELKAFASRNPHVIFSEVVNIEDEDYTEGSLKFDGFTVLFRCHDGGSGYSFMETPLFEDKVTPAGCVQATYEALFKFDFSKIFFSIYDIHNAINDPDFKTLCFHSIVTEDDAVHAVSEILGFIIKNESLINGIANDSNLQTILTNNYFHDEKVFDKKFSVDSFNEDVENNAYLHEVISGLHLAIQDGVYKFLTTGNYKLLVKEFNKAEKKNNLIVFEKRYEKYLYDNNFQNTNEEISKKLISSSKKQLYTAILYFALMVISFIIAVAISYLLTNITVSTFYSDALFLGTTKSLWFTLGLIVATMLILVTVAHKIPVLKNKVHRLLFKEKRDKAVIIISIILLVLCSYKEVDTYKNHGIFIENDVLYVDNAAVDSKNSNIEFILIRGKEYTDENNRLVYESDLEYRELLYVFDGDYEGYSYCELLENDGYVTNQIINELKKANCKVSSYRTIEDFAERHGFEIDE